MSQSRELGWTGEFWCRKGFGNGSDARVDGTTATAAATAMMEAKARIVPLTSARRSQDAEGPGWSRERDRGSGGQRSGWWQG